HYVALFTVTQLILVLLSLFVEVCEPKQGCLPQTEPSETGNVCYATLSDSPHQPTIPWGLKGVMPHWQAKKVSS
ncbi:hypothetical protein BaRGS_00013853, partial [Batillaria attramentaria]